MGGRTKFFDGDLLEEVCKYLPRMIEQTSPGSIEQVNDAVVCFHELNYYNKEMLSEIARAFRPRVHLLMPHFRFRWFETMQGLKHNKDLDFQQLLQVPPLLPGSPNYKIIRCAFFTKGHCEVGSSCTYAHNMHAPISLTDVGNEEGRRMGSVLLTHVQMYSVGNDAYARAALKH